MFKLKRNSLGHTTVWSIQMSYNINDLPGEKITDNSHKRQVEPFYMIFYNKNMFLPAMEPFLGNPIHEVYSLMCF